MAEVSVIVPVYQVEQYIRPCVDSILAQTFTDFELILVDDGSTDRSGEICDAYARMDARVCVIHQNNEGVASARNHGLEQAHGTFICFVDGDDWIAPDMFEKCVNQMKEQDADVLRHGHIMELWKDGRCVQAIPKDAPDFIQVLTHDRIKAEMESFWKNCSNYVWNYFFAKETIGNVRFPLLRISEDHIFVLQVLQQCKKITFSKENPYHYGMRMGSSANRWQETGIHCQLEMIRACHEFMEEFGIEEMRKKKLLSQMIFQAYSYSIYLLCFPECRLSLRKKLEYIRQVRAALVLDEYLAYVSSPELCGGDRLKFYLICRGKEHFLLRMGPLFLRIVRKARG